MWQRGNGGARELGFALALAAVSAATVLYVTGTAYEPFSWKAFAQVYENPGEPPTGDANSDPDSDAIKTAQRDPQMTTFNPSGCFFNIASGAIVPGGMVAATCTNCGGTETNIPKNGDAMDGSNGCFAFKYTMGPNPPSPPTGGIGAVFNFTITPPPHCVLAADCPDQGSFATSDAAVSPPAAVSIGNFPNAALTAISPTCTPWYTQVTFDTEDDSHVVSAVINNNIPLDCCGDGLVSGDEACDDGNFVGGDGCAADCSIIEPGFECPTPGSPCLAICGDRLIVGDETCDDGNLVNGDCCTSECQFDPEDCPAAAAPALGTTAMGLAVLTLLGVVFLALRRRSGAA